MPCYLAWGLWGRKYRERLSALLWKHQNASMQARHKGTGCWGLHFKLLSTAWNPPAERHAVSGEWPCWNQFQRFDPIVCLFLLSLQTRCRWSSKNNAQPKDRLIYESDIMLHFKKDPVWSEMNRLLARHYQASCHHLSVGSSWTVTSCEPQSCIREWGFLYNLLA